MWHISDGVPWYQYSPTAIPGKAEPLVVVRLYHGSKWVRLVALVDSGADNSLINIEYAEILGLDRNQATTSQVVGASGLPFPVYTWPAGLLELQFEAQRFPFQGVFLEYGPKTEGVNLLGRSDFFSQFVVQFWDARMLLNIDLSPDHPYGDASAQIRRQSRHRSAR
jgi:hypothetical protein